MPRSCCIPGCTRRSDREKGLHFYKIPKGKTPFEGRRKRDWLAAIKREDWDKPEWTAERINKQAVCSYHFVSGERSDDPNNVDWVPNKFDPIGASPKRNTRGKAKKRPEDEKGAQSTRDRKAKKRLEDKTDAQSDEMIVEIDDIETVNLRKRRRAAWLKAINRDDIDQNNKHMRVCGAHFISGKPSALFETRSADWVPSLNMGHDVIYEKPVVKKYKCCLATDIGGTNLNYTGGYNGRIKGPSRKRCLENGDQKVKLVNDVTMASDESVTTQQVEIKVEPTDETTDEKPSTDTRVTTQETIQDTTQSHQHTIYTQDTTQSHQVQPTMYTAISTRPPLPNGANFGHCLTPTMGPPLNPAFFAPLYSSFKELTADQSGQLRLVNPGLVPVPVPSTIAQQHIPIAQPQVPIAQPLAVESTRYDWSDEKTKFLVTIWRDMYRRLNSATSNKLKLKLYTEMHKNFTRVFPGNLTIVQMKTKLRGIGNQYKEKKKSLASTTGICDNYSDFMDQSLFDELDLFLDDKKGSKKSDTTPVPVTETPSRVVLRASASAAVESIAGIPSKGLPQRRVRRRNSGVEDVADLVKQYIKRDEEFSNEILRRMDNMTNRFIEANERQTDRFLAGLREILRD